MPSAPGYARNYKHEDQVRDSKPGEIKKREARNTARLDAIRRGQVHKGDSKQVDHIRPLSKGGTNKATNIRVISAHLNESYPRDRYGKMIHQNARLLSRP